MSRLLISSATLLFASAAWAQSARTPSLEAPTTLPVLFTRSIDAGHAKVDDPVQAKTIQRVQLSDGSVLPVGTRVLGHVVAANGFRHDKTPYAHQGASVLSVHFDTVAFNGQAVPVNVTVRAIAGPIATRDAESPKSSDLDSLGTLTQIGGDQLIPSQSEVRNMEGDVVAYNRRDGVYAHLIANRDCDGSTQEVSVANFSASACGVYGLGNVSAVERGSAAAPSTLTLISTHGSPELLKYATALLEVLPQQQASLER